MSLYFKLEYLFFLAHLELVNYYDDFIFIIHSIIERDWKRRAELCWKTFKAVTNLGLWNWFNFHLNWENLNGFFAIVFEFVNNRFSCAASLCPRSFKSIDMDSENHLSIQPRTPPSFYNFHIFSLNFYFQ